MVGFVRDKASVHSHISAVVVMHVLVKRDIFEFIEHICTKNWMVLCELHQ